MLSMWMGIGLVKSRTWANMNGLSTINIELTSRCNKKCWCCGRRKLEKEFPETTFWGDMPYETVQEIAKQIPKGIVVQLHNNGDPLLYPFLGNVLGLLRDNIRCFNTNAKLLMERSDEIIGNLETLTISVIQDDPEAEEQYEIVRRFLERWSGSPILIYRLLGNVPRRRWEELPGTVVERILHSPWGSREYTKSPTIPEIGICLCLLNYLTFDRYGNMSLCPRFDPNGFLRIGNIKDMTMEQAWHSEFRAERITKHIAGKRQDIPGCNQCHYWGVPRGD